MEMVHGMDEFFFPKTYLVVRYDPPAWEKSQRPSWFVYDTHLACEVDRISAKFARKLIKEGKLVFSQEQEVFHRTFYKAADYNFFEVNYR